MLSTHQESKEDKIIYIPDDILERTSITCSNDYTGIKEYKLNLLGNYSSEKRFKLVPVKNLNFHPDKIQVSDIKQGHMGNCAFIATLRTIARRYPKFVSDMLTEIDDQHTAVRLFLKENGKFNRVFYKIKKTIVTPAADMSTFFLPVPTEENWIKLIEKALVFYLLQNQDGLNFEKYLPIEKTASYEDLITAMGQELIHKALLGSQTIRYQASFLFSSDQVKKYFIDSEICHINFKSNNIGMFERHAYELVNFAKHNQDEFVILSNPWGNNGKDQKFDCKKIDMSSFELSIKYQNEMKADNSIVVMPLDQCQKYADLATMTKGIKQSIARVEKKFDFKSEYSSANNDSLTENDTLGITFSLPCAIL